MVEGADFKSQRTSLRFNGEKKKKKDLMVRKTLLNRIPKAQTIKTKLNSPKIKAISARKEIEDQTNRRVTLGDDSTMPKAVEGQYVEHILKRRRKTRSECSDKSTRKLHEPQ